MIKFTFPEYQYLQSAFESFIEGQFEIKHFPNREMYITVDTDVSGKDCLIIGTIGPPDENLIKVLFLAHTLKKEGANKITLLLPYLAYARHDKQKKGESLITEEIGRLLEISHVNEVITIEAHSQTLNKLYPIPVISLSAAELFGEKIEKLSLENPTFIAPDEGAISRTQELFNESGRNGSTAYFKKQRSDDEKIRSELEGKVSNEAIVVDDILDTGSTLVSACEHLQAKGVKEIYIMVTHGLFTGDIWKKLWDLNVKKIYCTDTIPNQAPESSNITIISILPIIKEYFPSAK